MMVREIMRALTAGTEFLYGKEGYDFGDFSGCGEASQILERASRILGIQEVHFNFGHARYAETPDEEVAHAWLEVDGAIFDPSSLAMGFEVIEYSPWNPREAEQFQSDLKECLINLDRKEVAQWAERTARVMSEVL